MKRYEWNAPGLVKKLEREAEKYLRALSREKERNAVLAQQNKQLRIQLRWARKDRK